MILLIVPNGAADFTVQAREVAEEHWPGLPTSAQNPARIDLSTLDFSGVDGVVMPTGFRELAVAIRNHNILAVEISPRKKFGSAKPSRDGPARVELVFPVEVYPELVQVHLALPDSKLLALVPCLRSFSHLSALIHDERTGQARTEVLAALVRRTIELKGVLE